MKKITFLFLLICSFSTAYSQQATIKGKVTDKLSGDEIFGAYVSVNGVVIAATGFDGSFEIKADPGQVEVKVAFISYADFIEVVNVEADQIVEIEVGLSESGKEIGTLVVEVEVDKSSSKQLILERMNSSQVIESVGAQQLARQAVSEVETGVTKLSGVSRVSSGGVFVRGLGDRYNNAYLNGMPIASPDPNKKIIDMSIFPTSMVRSISVSKVYNVDQFADMSGASIDILTKEGDEDYVSVNTGLGLNTNSTFKDFYTSKRGDLNYLGINGSGRAEPKKTFDNGIYTLVDKSKNPFKSGFNIEKTKAPLNNKFGLQFAKSFKGEKTKYGVMFSASYRNRFRQDEGTNKILDNNLNPTSDLWRTRYRYNANVTGYLGTHYEIKGDKRKHKVNFNYIFLNGSNNNYLTSQGNTDEDDSPETMDQRITRSRYVEQRMNTIQLQLAHEWTRKLSFEWGGSYTSANTIEPDRQDLKAIMVEGETEFGIITPDVSTEKQRYFQNTYENEYYGFASVKYGFGEPVKEMDYFKHTLTLGVQKKLKTRDINVSTYLLNFKNVFQNKEVDLLNLDEHLTDAEYEANNYNYYLTIDASNFLYAERDIIAPYAFADFKIGKKLNAVPGVRLEKTYQQVQYRETGAAFDSRPNLAIVDQMDVLPAMSLKYKLNDTTMLRLGASYTLVRPNFRELIPLVFYDQNLNATTGNPNLKNSNVYNVDAKYEIYPNIGELFSFGVYYKKILNPIEQIRSGVNFISFFNVTSADVIGAELEISKRVSSVFKSEKKFVNGLSIGGNASYLYSNISIDLEALSKQDPQTANTLINITNENRSLQGASPLLVNASLTYDSLFFRGARTSSISLVYNRFSNRIFSAGTQTRGDLYEKGFGTLDFVIRNEWKNGLSARLSIKNILNPSIERYQSPSVNADGSQYSGQQNVITQAFQQGINFNLSITYKINFNRE